MLGRRRVEQEVVEVVLSKLTRDREWDVDEAEIFAAATGGVLCDSQREHAVNIEAGAAGQVEPVPRARDQGRHGRSLDNVQGSRAVPRWWRD